jgi:hypothetical protein
MYPNLRIIRIKLNSKLSSVGGSPPEEDRPACRQAGSFGGKMQNDNAKLKINKIQKLVIARSGAAKQSPSLHPVIASAPKHRGKKQSLSFRRVIASYPSTSGNEAISLNEL